ncbi:alkylglycerol monooxygenase-like [Tropilaelaps mercedesae]|uniref:Alkylglycerol monooxygenase-like n=1 Tax=Tropilaelaps mercedesae TaxID=418985 RepID=A0A1V9Y2X9_9ACAR|nr:alkylglycerol monooxygenase-like [Tropilaelaps mercedesae]
MEDETITKAAYDAWEQLSNISNCTEARLCFPEAVFKNFTFHARFLMFMVTPTQAFDHYSVLPMRDLINDVIAPFMVLGFIEYFLIRLFGGRWGHIAEYLPNVYSGMLSQTFRLAFHVVEFWLYTQVYDYWHLVFADSVNWKSWTAWVVVAVMFDFCYYWFHRCGHEMAIFWTMHQVHHSSGSFNYSISFRIPHVHDFIHSGLFYLPMALLGVPPDVTFLHKIINLLYQFWIHTELIPKLGPIEWIFNTASHHRVHHARQAKYLDKNYGSVLIIWDRIFGTFYEEDDGDKPIYGLTKPQNSLNVFYYQVCMRM